MSVSEQHADPRGEVRTLLALGWALAVLATYLGPYEAWLKPFQLVILAADTWPALRPGPHFLDFLLLRGRDVCTVVLILVEAWGLGALVIARITGRRGWLESLYAVGIGCWMIAAGVLALGAWSTAAVPLVLIGLAAWLVPETRSFVRLPSWSRQPLGAWDWFLVSCLVIAILCNLPGIMTPPLEYDAVEYHLGAPADYLRAGRIIYLPHNFYSNLPQLTEMLYLLLLTLTTDVATKLLHSAFGVLTAVGLILMGRRLGSHRLGLTAAVLFYCVPFVQHLSQTARIDLATSFYGALALGGLVLAQRERVPQGEWARDNTRWVWLVALACGGAVATKWTAIGVLLLPVLAYLLVAERSWPRAVMVGAVAVALASPWLIKNLLLTGNPVYPLLTNLILHPDWSASQAAMFARRHYATFADGAWQEGLTRLWHYSFVEPGAVPLLLMTVPLVVFPRRQGPDRTLLRTALLLFLFCWAGWYLLTYRPWRFLFPVLPLAALVAGWALDHLAKIVRWVVAGCLGLSLATLAMSSLVPLDDTPAGEVPLSPATWALGRVSREEFLRRFNNGSYAPIMWMNRELPAEATVLYIGEARVYYSRHPVLWSTAYDRHPLQGGALGSVTWPDQVTHVYVNYSEWRRLAKGYEYLAEIDAQSIDQALDRQGRVVFSNKWARVYELR